ncbi:hypothetical protein GOODEAATRI_029778 [Goodea atripinnis]|uniref:Uncharacterized protein n=1 Tax=Goodea atripinnis TaxID=208336 RepID=A0ABV0NP83_9TELE
MSFGASYRKERALRGVCGTSDPRIAGGNVGHIFPYGSHRDTLAVLVLSSLCPRFAIPLGGLRETWEGATGSWVGSFQSYSSVLRDCAGKADLGQSRGLYEAWEWATGSWVGSFRLYRSVLRGRVGKADLGQSREQKAFQEADPWICRFGVVPKRTSPPWRLWDLGPPNSRGKNVGHVFPYKSHMDGRVHPIHFVDRMGHGWARFDCTARCYAAVWGKPT